QGAQARAGQLLLAAGGFGAGIRADAGQHVRHVERGHAASRRNVSSALSAAPPSMVRAAWATPSLRSAARAATISAAAAFSSTVSRYGPAAPRSRASRAAALVAASP